MRCRAESVPIVISVPQKSLSIEPTMPTMFKWLYFSRCSLVISPALFLNKIIHIWMREVLVYKWRVLLSLSSLRRSAHSCLKRFAPVNEPSPPMTTKLDIPRWIKFLAARRRPGRSRKSWQRAEPITVPPYESIIKCDKCISLLFYLLLIKLHWY